MNDEAFSQWVLLARKEDLYYHDNVFLSLKDCELAFISTLSLNMEVFESTYYHKSSELEHDSLNHVLFHEFYLHVIKIKLLFNYKFEFSFIFRSFSFSLIILHSIRWAIFLKGDCKQALWFNALTYYKTWLNIHLSLCPVLFIVCKYFSMQGQVLRWSWEALDALYEYFVYAFFSCHSRNLIYKYLLLSHLQTHYSTESLTNLISALYPYLLLKSPYFKIYLKSWKLTIW